MFDAHPSILNDRPAQYPDTIRVRTPRGFRDRVSRAAAVERVPVSELIRRAVFAYLDDPVGQQIAAQCDDPSEQGARSSASGASDG